MSETTKSTPNIDLLKRVMAHIDADPKHWFQGWYRHKTDCGTAYCFAGWALTLSGYKWIDDDTVRISRSAKKDAGNTAQELLQLTEEQADDLFAGLNNLTGLRRIVNEIIEEAGGEPYVRTS